MPQWPHEYTLKKWNPELKDTFEKFVIHIREHGRSEKILGGDRILQYFYIGEHKYWTMGAPLDETILINRAKVNG